MGLLYLLVDHIMFVLTELAYTYSLTQLQHSSKYYLILLSSKPLQICKRFTPFGHFITIKAGFHYHSCCILCLEQFYI